MDSVEGCQSDCFEIAIVGGGSSGALVAAQVLRSGFSGRLAIIETRPRLGHGLAYSTPFEQHLLNVPTRNMSAFPDEPMHFCEWLRARNWPGASPEAFAPRKVYGEYIEDVLWTSVRGESDRSFQHIRGEVEDARTAGDRVILTLNDRRTIEAVKVVLALGNPASSPFESPSIQSMGERWNVSPWIGDALRVRFAGERILLVGAGLTAVDSALALHGQSQSCKTYIISRRGILPQVHDLSSAPGSPPVFDQPGNIRKMFGQLRAQIGRLREANGCWRTAVDALRPVSNEMWHRMPLSDRSRFLRHLKTYWETHRHRMAPQIRRRMDELRERGEVEVIAGRIRETRWKGDVVEATIGQRCGRERLLEIDRAINCTGIQENYKKSPRRLIRKLIEHGLAIPGDLGTGFRTDEFGALLDAHGRSSSALFTLGPPRRGELFETTAIPEIRVQAAALAQHLIHEMAVAAA
jgi:uncharacterized NAD(P)/FAD-binding protein YdhS